IKSITGSSGIPFFGYGIGMGTSVGGVLLSGDRVMLIYAEDEWARLTGEMGAVLGLAMIYIRLGLSYKLAVGAFRRLTAGDLLPWFLLSFCLLNLPQGQWGQPTSLGFTILIGGLSMASLKAPEKIVSKPSANKSATTPPIKNL
ncbi:MAG: hypothetical protein ABIU30_25160, partial [Ferruginibacter sp.]